MRNGSSAHNDVSETSDTATSSHTGSALHVEALLSEDGVHEHPTLFIREDMVVIQVQNIKFRIPSFHLTEHSICFSTMLATREHNVDVVINEEDVTAHGFECLLLLLHPRVYGTTPHFNLSQWIDVLHLSDKWGFNDLRVAAIKAIYPLASPVDRICLGLKYSFDGWTASAFEDLLIRDDDLTFEEGSRLGMDMVIKLTSGRLRARRMCGLKSKKELKDLVSELTSRSNSTLATSTNHEHVLSRPIEQLDWHGKDVYLPTPPLEPETSKDPITAVMEPLAQPPEIYLGLKQRDAIMSAIASSSLLDVSVTPAQRRQSPNNRDHPSPCFLFGMPDHGIWQSVRTSMSHNDFNACMRTCWLAIIGSWDALSTLAHDWESIRILGSDSFPYSSLDVSLSQWRMLVIATRYMRHLMDKGIILEDSISPGLFIDFWQTMTGLADSLEACSMPKLAPCELYRKLRALASLVRLFGSSVVTSAASDAMNDFYTYVEQAQSAAQITGDRLVVFAYQELVATRPESTVIP